MTALKDKTEKTFVLTRGTARFKRFAQLHSVQVSSIAEARRRVEESVEPSLWISFEEALTNAVLRSVRWPSKPLGRVLLIHRANLASLTALRKCFASVAFCEDGGFLGVEELAEVLKSPKRDDLFIGGFADDASRTVTFWRGNLDSMTVPFSAFESSGDGVSPDMSKLTVTDCGQTVQFGDYEASVDAILYEHDSDYRRKVRENLRKCDSSFGGSIRRLRKQKRLRRTDFLPLSERTIARIERGESENIHPRTLKILAGKLGVPQEELDSF